jgi:RNA polymerase sigma factor (sigma-70 family)
MPSPSLTLLRAQSDDRLVALARDGHERAFEAIVERYRRPLLRAARRVLPEARAEDALQQALIAAWTALQRGDDVRDLRAWLYRVVHNTALNQLRVSGYDYVELEDALRIAGAGADDLERRAVVRQTLASLAALPDRQREALLRTAVSGYSQEEVARDLGISDNAMRQLVHRARVTMRAAVTAVTPAPLVTAAASGTRGGSVVDRIAELAAGAAPAGAAATLAKTGTAVLIAGGALGGPTLVDRVAGRPERDVTAAAATVAGASRSGPPAGEDAPDERGRSTPSGASAAPRPARRAPSGLVRRGGGRGHGRAQEHGVAERRPLGDDERSGEDHSGRGGPGDDGGTGEHHSGGGSGGGDRSGHGGGDRSASSGSGSGSGDGGSSGSGGSGSGGSGSGHGGSGSGSDDALPLASATPSAAGAGNAGEARAD